MEKTEVLVIGSGPVGLLLSLLLARRGIEVTCVDKRKEPSRQSRAIGIHPPLLDFLEELNLLPEFLQLGTEIRETAVYFDKLLQGKVDLSCVSSRNKYVLSIPQYETEKILTNALSKQPTASLYRRRTFSGLSKETGFVTASFEETDSICANYLVGADGFQSTVRELLEIPVWGSRYNDYYSMADFSQQSSISSSFSSSFSGQASIFLGDQGLLECFPIGGYGQRWVARVGNSQVPDCNRAELRQMIEQRKPKEIPCGECFSTPQTFWTGKFSSKNFFADSVVLVGDAAHVVSPIGGQGMNLGWLGAVELSKQMHLVLRHGKSHLAAFAEYQKKLQATASAVRRRAEWNMSFGRPGYALKFRTAALMQLLNSPFEKRLVDTFTMGRLSV